MHLRINLPKPEHQMDVQNNGKTAAFCGKPIDSKKVDICAPTLTRKIGSADDDPVVGDESQQSKQSPQFSSWRPTATAASKPPTAKTTTRTQIAPAQPMIHANQPTPQSFRLSLAAAITGICCALGAADAQAQTNSIATPACAKEMITTTCTPNSDGVFVEYQNLDSKVHFITSCGDEVALLDADTAHFRRTGQTVALHTSAESAAATNLRRYLISVNPLSMRHFWTVVPPEYLVIDQFATGDAKKACVEHATSGYAAAPTGLVLNTDGSLNGTDQVQCARGTQPIWRAFNAKNPGHRYTSSYAYLTDTVLALSSAEDGWSSESVRLCGPGAMHQVELTPVATSLVPSPAGSSAFAIQYIVKNGAPSGAAQTPNIDLLLPAPLSYSSALGATCSLHTFQPAAGQRLRCSMSQLAATSSANFTLNATANGAVPSSLTFAGIAIGSAGATPSASESTQLDARGCVGAQTPSYGCSKVVATQPPTTPPPSGGIDALTFTGMQANNTSNQSVTISGTLTNTGTASLSNIRLQVEAYYTQSGAWDTIINATWTPASAKNYATFAGSAASAFSVTADLPARFNSASQPVRICAFYPTDIRDSNAFATPPACTDRLPSDAKASSQLLVAMNSTPPATPPQLSVAGSSGITTSVTRTSTTDTPTYSGFSFTVLNSSTTTGAANVTCSAVASQNVGIAPSCSMRSATLNASSTGTCDCTGGTLTTGSSFTWTLSAASTTPSTTTTPTYVAVSVTTQQPATGVLSWASSPAPTATPANSGAISVAGTLSQSNASTGMPVTIKVQAQDLATNDTTSWADLTLTTGSATGTVPATGSYAFSGGVNVLAPTDLFPNASALRLRLCAMKTGLTIAGSGSFGIGRAATCADIDSAITVTNISAPVTIVRTPPLALVTTLTSPSTGVLSVGETLAGYTVNVSGIQGQTLATTPALLLAIEAPANYELSVPVPTIPPTASCTLDAGKRLALCPVATTGLGTPPTLQTVTFALKPLVGAGGVSPTATLYANVVQQTTPPTSAACSAVTASNGGKSCATASVTPTYSDWSGKVTTPAGAAITTSFTASSVAGSKTGFATVCALTGTAAPAPGATCKVTIRNGETVLATRTQTLSGATATELFYLVGTGVTGVYKLCAGPESSAVCAPLVADTAPPSALDTVNGNTITSFEVAVVGAGSSDNNAANDTSNRISVTTTDPPVAGSCSNDPNVPVVYTIDGSNAVTNFGRKYQKLTTLGMTSNPQYPSAMAIKVIVPAATNPNAAPGTPGSGGGSIKAGVLEYAPYQSAAFGDVNISHCSGDFTSNGGTVSTGGIVHWESRYDGGTVNDGGSGTVTWLVDGAAAGQAGPYRNSAKLPSPGVYYINIRQRLCSSDGTSVYPANVCERFYTGSGSSSY